MCGKERSLSVMARTIEIDENITVGALAEKLSLPATKLIAELFKNGIMVTINENIDAETGQIIVDELGLEIELVVKKTNHVAELLENRQRVVSDNATSRPPVVAVMGHVDHGKTSLLDVIRSTEVVNKEAGGITQHISAYQLTHKDRKITFLDTPGHEAFAALREHGARLTDVAIIVIAADDGIKPQTLEAIRFARKANVKMVVAVTKIDKPGANVERVKQQLSENDMLPEEWGGQTVVAPLSSKTKVGLDNLLDMVLLVSDIEELKADVDVPAEGLIIESHMEHGRGAVAIALVEQGTLHKGDYIVAGDTYAKVKVLESTTSGEIVDAKPSTPVIITGFKALPEFGESFTAVKNEKLAKQLVHIYHKDHKQNAVRSNMSSKELIRLINQKTKQQELNIVLKADVQGSLTSVSDVLKTLDTDEVAIRIVGSSVGSVNENDIRMASSSDAIIYGFNVDMPQSVKQISMREKVKVKLYRVIYELIDDAKNELSELLSDEELIEEKGRLIVRGVFNTTKSVLICGGEVTKGKLVIPSFANIFRDNEKIASDLVVTNLKHGPTDTKEVIEGEMCGISLATNSKIEVLEGDRIELYTKETIKRSL
jgi:translation initiation factor IF-2